MTWEPSDYDIAWTRNLWSKLKVGGVWSYTDKPIQVQKLDQYSARLLVSAESQKVFSEDISRLKKVMGKLDITFQNGK